MTASTEYPLLYEVDGPESIRHLSASTLHRLTAELRGFLIESVARSGGHFAANLGTVELTVALHYCFNTPRDRLIWDVGHQSYPHKILTGRRDRLATIRQRNGLAPFTKRDESAYDSFGVGHASTSISAGLGMAAASHLRGDSRKVVAIIGDGAMTAGMAYEALNHGGDLNRDVLIVLNDNEMSISPNVGAMSQYLTRLLSGPLYATMREGGRRVLSQMPPVWELARRTKDQVKNMVIPGGFFEELGVDYYGPVDGHDLDALVRILSNLHGLEGPRLLHVVTRKGKGYAQAEANPVSYHGVKPFDLCEGLPASSGKPSQPTYTEVFSDWICHAAAHNPTLVAITPAMREGSGLIEFENRYPDRYFDVGIAEQHAVTLAAGMACEGLHPVVAIYSTFLQRAYDQFIHDVALQKLPVLFAIDRAGIVGPDGPTHGGSFDLSFLRTIPHLVLMAPADEAESQRMLQTGLEHDGPAAVRYPRGRGPGVACPSEVQPLPIGQAEWRRRGRGDVCFLAFGDPVSACLEVAEERDAGVLNMRFVKPLDHAAIRAAAAEYRLLVTVEENAVAGGAGSGVGEVLAAQGIDVALLHLGIPDAFVEHGERGELLHHVGLDAAGIRAAVQERLRRMDAGWTPVTAE